MQNRINQGRITIEEKLIKLVILTGITSVGPLVIHPSPTPAGCYFIPTMNQEPILTSLDFTHFPIM